VNRLIYGAEPVLVASCISNVYDDIDLDTRPPLRTLASDDFEDVGLPT
jgi:hypothetical protein